MRIKYTIYRFTAFCLFKKYNFSYGYEVITKIIDFKCIVDFKVINVNSLIATELYQNAGDFCLPNSTILTLLYNIYSRTVHPSSNSNKIPIIIIIHAVRWDYNQAQICCHYGYSNLLWYKNCLPYDVVYIIYTLKI